MPLDGRLQEETEAATKPPKIRCPLCGWEPRAGSRWYCWSANYTEGCGHYWNTFDTHGQCPQCKKRHANTDCHGCKRWSPHEDWYD